MKRCVVDASTLAATALGLFLLSCTPRAQRTEQVEDATRSPNATILPAPLASVAPQGESALDASLVDVWFGIPADSKGRLILSDAGSLTAVQPLIPTEPLPPDNLAVREGGGVTLNAEWIWSNVPAPPHAPEVNTAGIESARKAVRRLWIVDIVDAGRMRIVFDSVSLSLTKFTELRGRYDRFGNVLVWPGGDQYRVIAPGALRALLDERRVDVTPLIPEKAKPLPSQGPRFGFPTTRAQIGTPTGKIAIDQAHVVSVGLGGALLCRTLVELVAVDPSAPTCAQNLLPVHADYTWPDGSTLQFDVVSLNVRTDYVLGALAVPPAAATFTSTGLPPEAAGIFLTRDQLAAFRSRPIDPTHVRTDPESKGAPGEGFLAVNSSDSLRFLLIDGVPVAWVPAHGRQYLIGTTRGRYVVQWRSFLGSYVGPAAVLEFPALLTSGETPDAGDSKRTGGRER